MALMPWKETSSMNEKESMENWTAAFLHRESRRLSGAPKGCSSADPSVCYTFASGVTLGL